MSHTHIHQALSLWDLPDRASLRLINVSENETFLVESPTGDKAILRAHRQGYHSLDAIKSEIAWAQALKANSAISTPDYYTGRDGAVVQTIRLLDGSEQHLVMFSFVEGQHPDETQEPLKLYEQLGRIAATAHLQAMAWQRPAGFQRLTWDVETIFGNKPHWGNWRDAPNVTPQITEILEQVETKIRERLGVYGKSNERFGLIHGDMRFANLLVDRDVTHLIDFDDCGFSWFLYDFAAAISFIEDHPDIPKFKAAWLKGYRDVRSLSAEDEAEIDTFIMLRRMTLLAWIGSHIEAPEPQALAPDFARVTVELGQKYLNLTL